MGAIPFPDTRRHITVTLRRVHRGPTPASSPLGLALDAGPTQAETPEGSRAGMRTPDEDGRPRQESTMTLATIRALLKTHGYKTTAEIDRFDVKRAAGEVIGVDVMLTDGTVAYLPVEASA